MLSKSKTWDEELVKGLCSGDESCFDSLFRMYSAAIFKVCRCYRLGQSDSEEVVQEVFIKVWENKGRLNPDFSFKAYLYTIAKNIILKHLRRQTIDFAFKQYIASTKPEAENTTENTVYFNELSGYSEHIINQLSPQRKQAFLMAKMEGLSAEEIAQKLGISKRTVEHHIYLAQKFIRERFTGLKVSIVLFFFLFL